MEDYPFPEDIKSRSYRIFDQELENDEEILFHGTSMTRLAKILEEGFKPGPSVESVSFARTSPLALHYACEVRSEIDDGCVIVVKYSDLMARGVKIEHSIVYDYRTPVQAQIIGSCRIPASYQHT